MNAVLLSPWLDPMLLGGLSVLTYLLFALSSHFSSSFGVLPGVTLGMNILFGSPHIMAAYGLFYGAKGPWRRHAVVAWLVPAIIAGLLGAAVMTPSSVLMNRLGQIFIMFICWHFLMQSFGVSLWLRGFPRARSPGTLRGRKIFKTCVLIGCVLIGVAGSLGMYQAGTADIFNLKISSPFPESFARNFSWLGAAGLGSLFLGLAADQALGESGPSSWPAAVPLIALYFWFDPRFASSPLRALFPAFHGIQYLTFYVKSQLVSMRPRMDLWEKTAAACVSWLWIILAGYVFFRWLPGRLAGCFPAFLPDARQRIVASVLIFLNVHHHFIDSVLWKMSEPEVRARLGLPS